MDTPMADPTQPLEILRTIHSSNPCLACSNACHEPGRTGNGQGSGALRGGWGDVIFRNQGRRLAWRAGDRRKSVYVYEATVRIWHWVNALAILTWLWWLTAISSALRFPPFRGRRAPTS